jgi:hypothetical protein
MRPSDEKGMAAMPRPHIVAALTLFHREVRRCSKSIRQWNHNWSKFRSGSFTNVVPHFSSRPDCGYDSANVFGELELASPINEFSRGFQILPFVVVTEAGIVFNLSVPKDVNAEWRQKITDLIAAFAEITPAKLYPFSLYSALFSFIPIWCVGHPCPWS